MTKEEFIRSIFDNYTEVTEMCGMVTTEDAINKSVAELDQFLNQFKEQPKKIISDIKID